MLKRFSESRKQKAFSIIQPLALCLIPTRFIAVPWEINAQFKRACWQNNSPHNQPQHSFPLSPCPLTSAVLDHKNLFSTSQCSWISTTLHNHFTGPFSISSQNYSLKTWNLPYSSSLNFPFILEGPGHIMHWSQPPYHAVILTFHCWCSSG